MAASTAAPAAPCALRSAGGALAGAHLGRARGNPVGANAPSSFTRPAARWHGIWSRGSGRRTIFHGKHARICTGVA